MRFLFFQLSKIYEKAEKMCQPGTGIIDIDMSQDFDKIFKIFEAFNENENISGFILPYQSIFDKKIREKHPKPKFLGIKVKKNKNITKIKEK